MGPAFWPGITFLRPTILSVIIGLTCFKTPEWFLAIYAFYRSKKYQIGPIFWQFIPKIRAGAQILTRDLSLKAKHFVCRYCFAMLHASWVVSTHKYLLQIEKIPNWSVLWQFIPKIRGGTAFWLVITLSRPKVLYASIGLPCFMTPEWFLAIYAFCWSKIYKIGPILCPFIAIYT